MVDKDVLVLQVETFMSIASMAMSKELHNFMADALPHPQAPAITNTPEQPRIQLSTPHTWLSW
jgi:hypothetical protein